MSDTRTLDDWLLRTDTCVNEDLRQMDIGTKLDAVINGFYNKLFELGDNIPLSAIKANLRDSGLGTYLNISDEGDLSVNRSAVESFLASQRDKTKASVASAAPQVQLAVT